jgi:hypothetical protein
MSQLEVDKIIPQSGTTLTIGDSGDTVNFADGTSIGIDTNTLYIDSTNNRVGIGTTSPGAKLEIQTASDWGNIINSTYAGTQYFQQFEYNGTSIGKIRGDNSSISIESGSNLILQTANTERMRITSSGDVGIGTSAPDAKLSVTKAGAGAFTVIKAKNGTVAADTGASIELSGFYKAGKIAGTNDNAGTSYAGALRFYTNSNSTNDFVQRMIINSSGNVGIGTASPSQKLDVSGSLNVTGTGNFVASGTRRVEVSGDGFSTFTGSPILDGGIEFTNQFGHVYSIGVSNGDNLRIYDGGTELLRVAPSGVLFNGAGSYLDDYEEGTWTGELRGATTAATTPVTSIGRYVKIGRLVFVKIYISNVNTTGASGQAQIAGLPFAAESLQILPVMTYGQDYDDSGGVMSIQMYLENNTTAQLLVTKDNGAWQGTSITAGTNKFYALTGSYYTTS